MSETDDTDSSGSDSESASDRGHDEISTWPELAIDLYDRLTGRGAEITYEFEEMEVDVPNTTGANPEFAQWRIDGTIRVRSRDGDRDRGVDGRGSDRDR